MEQGAAGAGGVTEGSGRALGCVCTRGLARGVPPRGFVRVSGEMVLVGSHTNTNMCSMPRNLSIKQFRKHVLFFK